MRSHENNIMRGSSKQSFLFRTRAGRDGNFLRNVLILLQKTLFTSTYQMYNTRTIHVHAAYGIIMITSVTKGPRERFSRTAAFRLVLVCYKIAYDDLQLLMSCALYFLYIFFFFFYRKLLSSPRT